MRFGLTRWSSAPTLAPNPPLLIYLDAMRTHAIALAGSLFLTVGLLAACDSTVEEGPEGPTPEELFPLEVGNRWLYRTWYLRPSLADSFVVEITGRLSFEHGGETLTAYAESRHLLGEEPPPFRWLSGHGRDGLYLMGGIAPTDTMLTKRLVRRTPMRVGEGHRFTRLAYGTGWTTGVAPEERFYVSDDTLEVRLLAERHPFETPLGTFDCYVYWYEFLPADDTAVLWDVFDYYVPSIGAVAQVIKSGRNLADPFRVPEAIPTNGLDEGLNGAYLLYDYRLNE